jgi:hypothetical protein
MDSEDSGEKLAHGYVSRVLNSREDDSVEASQLLDAAIAGIVVGRII